MKYQHYIFIFFISLVGSGLYGQAKLSVTAPKYVKPGEQFQIKYTSNENLTALDLPQVKGLTYLAGPSTSVMSSTNNVNGKRVSTTEYSYTYVARFDAEGTYAVPATKGKAGRKDLVSNSYTVQVLAKTPEGKELPKLFMQWEPSKRTVYAGEAMVLELKLYRRIDINGIQGQKLPSFDGFFADQQEIKQFTTEEELLENEVFLTTVVARVNLIPQRTGDIIIGEAIQALTVSQRRSAFDIFDMDPFSNSPFGKTVQVKSTPITINVKELPEPKPAAFTGAVGNYSFSSSIKGDNITTNDVVSLQLRVSGSGNINLLSDLEPNLPPVFDMLEPQIKSNIKPSSAGYQGSKTFTYTLIPRSAGNFTMPAQEFVYFNPRSKTYETIKTEEYTVNIAKGDEDEGITVISGVSKEEVQYLGKDIRFIKTESSKYLNFNAFWSGKRFFLFALITIVGVFVLIIGLTLIQKKQRKDIGKYRNKRASELARKRLKTAQKYITKNSTDEFYAELLRAIWGYLEDKLQLSTSEINLDLAIETLQKSDVSEDVVAQLKSVCDTCEMARYAPTQVEGGMQSTYESAKESIISIEDKLK
jgi:hypothetical protein